MSCRHLALLLAIAGCTSAVDAPSGLPDSGIPDSSVQVPPAPSPIDLYEPPDVNAVFVAPGGGAQAEGTASAPLGSLAAAVALVEAKPPGERWTIVLRAGTYREGEIFIGRDDVTIQRYRSEEVQLWGTVKVSDFTGTGPYSATIDFDASGLEKDCADAHLLGAGRHFGSEFAFAVFRDGAPLERVESSPAVGQYSYDHATNTLVLADEPHNVEVTRYLHALKVKGRNFRLAGLDIQGYGSCVVNWAKWVEPHYYHNAALVIYRDVPEASNCRIENSIISNNAAGAVTMPHAQGCQLIANVITNNGWTGVMANEADGLVVNGNNISHNNFRRHSNFAQAGMKITHIEQGVILNNLFEHNRAAGFWCDQDCGTLDTTANWFIVARNLARKNERGLMYEVSHHAVIASNLAQGNDVDGIGVFGSNTVQLWNNTLVDNSQTPLGYSGGLTVVDDNRCWGGDTLPNGAVCSEANGCVPLAAGNWDACESSSAGPLANTCNVTATVLKNNLISGTRSVEPLLNVEDPFQTRYGAEYMVASNDYQAYWRPDTSTPASLIQWQTTPGAAAVSYATLAEYQAAHPGREANSVERAGLPHPFFTDYAQGRFTQKLASADVWGRGASLPAEVLKAFYWPQTNARQPAPRIGAIAWSGMLDSSTPAPLGGFPPAPQAGSGTCRLISPVFHRRHPATGDSFLTTSKTEAEAVAELYGYSDDLGVVFYASTGQLPGLAPVYQLFNPTKQAHLWTASESERSAAISSFGFTVDEGIGFYASSTSSYCLVPAYRLVRERHVLTTSEAQRNQLAAEGWTDEGIKLYVGSP